MPQRFTNIRNNYTSIQTIDDLHCTELHPPRYNLIFPQFIYVRFFSVIFGYADKQNKITF